MCSVKNSAAFYIQYQISTSVFDSVSFFLSRFSEHTLKYNTSDGSLVSSSLDPSMKHLPLIVQTFSTMRLTDKIS